MQTEFFGTGSIRAVKKIVSSLEAKRILLVTGQNSFTSSGAESALYRDLGGLDITRFSDFDVNPSFRDGLRGITLLKSSHPDLVIAVGGGSVLDMGKLITILPAQPHDDYETIVEKSEISLTGVPLVAIPTTSGTGSEATHFSVVYLRGKKFSLAHRFMLPDFAIIDAELTYNTGPYQTAVSGMDALCQGVESYWSVHSTVQSRAFAAKAIRSVLASLEDAVHFSSEQARQDLALGAHYGGKAINITKTTAPHALSYTLTSHYGIPHGHAAALMLGRFFLVNEAHTENTADERGPTYFSQIMAELYDLFGCRDAASCTKSWFRFMAAIGLKTELACFGITCQKDHDLILDGVNPERLGNHPVHLDRAILTNLFKPYR